MNQETFRIDEIISMREGYTISRNADMGRGSAVTFFQWAPIPPSVRSAMTLLPYIWDAGEKEPFIWEMRGEG